MMSKRNRSFLVVCVVVLASGSGGMALAEPACYAPLDLLATHRSANSPDSGQGVGCTAHQRDRIDDGRQERPMAMGGELGYYVKSSDEPAACSSSDPWFYFVYDDQWRIVATYRGSDSTPKEQFIYHAAGDDGFGGSSYIDATVLRDRDMTNGWAGTPNGSLEERAYYCQNWRADVVALVSGTGSQVQQVRYGEYVEAFGLPRGDTDGDGDRLKCAEHENTALSLSQLYAVRHRVYHAGLGRWMTRDPLENLDGASLYLVVKSNPIASRDAHGLSVVSECIVTKCVPLLVGNDPAAFVTCVWECYIGVPITPVVPNRQPTLLPESAPFTPLSRPIEMPPGVSPPSEGESDGPSQTVPVPRPSGSDALRGHGRCDVCRCYSGGWRALCFENCDIGKRNPGWKYRRFKGSGAPSLPAPFSCEGLCNSKYAGCIWHWSVCHQACLIGQGHLPAPPCNFLPAGGHWLPSFAPCDVDLRPLNLSASNLRNERFTEIVQ